MPLHHADEAADEASRARDQQSHNPAPNTGSFGRDRTSGRARRAI